MGYVNQNNNKNSQTFKIIVIVVLFLVCFGLGYLLAINVGGSDNKTNENKGESNTIKDKPVEDNKNVEIVKCIFHMMQEGENHLYHHTINTHI